MGRSTCVACGECVQACPTGALMPKSIVDPITQHGTREVDREVHSVCPYCGVGCQLSYQIKDEQASPSCRAATATPTRTVCASKAASASTMSPIRSG